MVTILAIVTLVLAASIVALRGKKAAARKSGGGWFGYVTLGGSDRKLFIAPFGGVYLNKADCIICFGELASCLKASASGKSLLVGFAKKNTRGQYCLEFSRNLGSTWADEFRLIRTEEERMTLLVRTSDLPAELAAPDEGETSDGNAAETLEEELARALLQELDPRPAPSYGAKRTPAQRLRDGE